MWFRLIFGFAAAAAVSLGARAHHSVAGNFDPGTTIEVEGAITGIHWRNPHVKFSMTVTGEGGEQEEWEIGTNRWHQCPAWRGPVADGDQVRVAGLARASHGAPCILIIMCCRGRDGSGSTPNLLDLRCRTVLGNQDRWFAETGDTSGAELGSSRSGAPTLARGRFFSG